jgi:hypothetical protein
MYILPYQVVRRALDSAGAPDAQQITTARTLIDFLLRQVVASTEFDDEGYLASNPDVAAAIRRGEVASGRDHYITDGYFEGREGAAAMFDESWYLKRYSDVARGVKSGQWMSGRQHYATNGMFEWRSPSQAAESDVARWRAAIAPLPALSSPQMAVVE